MNENVNNLPVDLTQAKDPFERGVNIGQDLKATAVVGRFTYDDSLNQTAKNGVNWTMQYHGAASGTILADERLEGVASYSGSEHCPSVATTDFRSYVYQTLGDNLADKAELAAFNSLPAMTWDPQLLMVSRTPTNDEVAYSRLVGISIHTAAESSILRETDAETDLQD